MDWRLVYTQFVKDLSISNTYAMNNLYDNVYDDKLLYVIDTFVQSNILGNQENDVRSMIEEACVNCVLRLLEEYSRDDI